MTDQTISELKARIVVNDFIAHQPAGGHGFRKGTWTYLLDGVPHKIWTSVPHGADCDVQYEMVKNSAARAIARGVPTINWKP